MVKVRKSGSIILYNIYKSSTGFARVAPVSNTSDFAGVAHGYPLSNGPIIASHAPTYSSVQRVSNQGLSHTMSPYPAAPPGIQYPGQGYTVNHAQFAPQMAVQHKRARTATSGAARQAITHKVVPPAPTYEECSVKVSAAYLNDKHKLDNIGVRYISLKIMLLDPTLSLYFLEIGYWD